jgi:hypothetical protein
MAGLAEIERRRLEAVYRRNRARWAEGELPLSELYHLELFNAAVARSGIAVPPLFPVGNAANAGLLYVLFRLAWEFSGLSVLELGAGQSSLLLDALRRAGRVARVLTLEHDAGWAARIGAQVGHEVRHAPLGPAVFADIATEVYDTTLDRKCDCVLIDGPIGTPNNSRLGALALLEQCLADDFVLVFDDAERPGERQTIERCLALYPGARHVCVHAAKSQCLVFTEKFAAVASFG